MDDTQREAQRRFDELLKQYNLTYTAFADDVRERTGISGFIASETALLTQGQIEEIARAFNALFEM